MKNIGDYWKILDAFLIKSSDLKPVLEVSSRPLKIDKEMVISKNR